jgi:hypothetical protein
MRAAVEERPETSDQIVLLVKIDLTVKFDHLVEFDHLVKFKSTCQRRVPRSCARPSRNAPKLLTKWSNLTESSNLM